MLPPCLIFLDGDGPADPLVPRKRRYVFPDRQRLRVGRERLLEINRKVMYDSSRDSNGCHRVISQAKGQASDTRVQQEFRDYRGLPVPNPSQPLLEAIVGPEIGLETDGRSHLRNTEPIVGYSSLCQNFASETIGGWLRTARRVREIA
jgi:hypothetical protein